ncbi:MAG: adenosylcobinamide-GDP ribazoletransferase [Lachnospiraceae bacterium]
MKWISSLIIACSMYSKIPMPKVEWNEKNMKYALCFFPLIGGVIGALLWGVGTLLYGKVSPLFFAVCMTLIPLAVTGGIHMDGFLDTVDAMASYGEREKKLEILKDPHAGAFAIIGAGCYFLWSVGIWSEGTADLLPVIACSFVLSRALSGYAVAAFVPAKQSGLVYLFHSQAQKTVVKITMAGYVVAAVTGMVLWKPVWAVAAVSGAVISFLWHRYICNHVFGGITGDLAGYFLQISELVMTTAVIVVSRL